MNKRFLIPVIILLSLLCAKASAQSNNVGNGEMRMKYGIGTTVKGNGNMMGATIDPKSIPMQHSEYYDQTLKQAEEELAEQAWGNEETAWERACIINTKESFQKYAARYPSGKHIAEAKQKIIDYEVNDIFKGDYGTLPGLNHTVIDDDSPSSTVVVENATSYTLTVYYSGSESKKIDILPGGRSAVSLPNGYYRIAATVPNPHIRPYAGSCGFSGGRYETGYCIVSY